MGLFSALGMERKCPACDEDFRGFTNDDYGKICPMCRVDFNINTNAEATALIAILDGVPAEGRKQAKALAKAGKGKGRGSAMVRVIPPPPKVDPAVVAAAVRSMITYGLVAPLPARLDLPTSYAIAKNGLFEVRDTDIARITFQPKDVVGLVDTLTTGVQLNIPKVPYEMLRNTVAFFRGVCKEAKGSSEAIVRIWWNRPEKRYEIRVPDGDQRVSGGSVNHSDTFDLEGVRDTDGHAIWLHVMDIHSHGSSMAAFWSGTDDGDEKKAPEGRMFGVIGKVLQPLPEWKWRMRSREGFIEMSAADIFEMGTVEDVPFTVTMDTILRLQGEAVKADGKITLACPVDPFKDAVFPEEWLKQVQHGWSRGSAHPHGDFRMGAHGGYVGGGGMGRGMGLKVAQFIYIKDKHGRLEEFEYDGTATKATGHFLDLSDGKPSVH